MAQLSLSSSMFPSVLRAVPRALSRGSGFVSHRLSSTATAVEMPVEKVSITVRALMVGGVVFVSAATISLADTFCRGYVDYSKDDWE